MNETDKGPAKGQTPGAPLNGQPKPKPRRIRRRPPPPGPKPGAAAPGSGRSSRKHAPGNEGTAGAGQVLGAARPRLIDEIRRLDIPGRAKAELFLLCGRARDLGRRILRFLKRHRHLGEAAVLGAVVAYALCLIPWIGGLLALVGLGLTLAGGVVRQLREDLEGLFESGMARA